MRLAVEVGSVADGTLRGALQYCKDLELERVVIPFASLEGYRETGSLDLDAARSAMVQIAEAGMSASGMVYWAPPAMVTSEPEGEADFGHLVQSMDVMAAVGADVLAMFATAAPPLDVAAEEGLWQQVIAFYRRLMAEAEARKIKVALHTVAMPSRNLLWSYAAVKRLFSEAPSPSSGVTFCVGNFWNSDGQRIYDIVRELGDRLFYVHTRSTREFLGETPFWFDSGGPDFRLFFEALRDINFQGDVRSEHMPEVAGENRTDIGTAWSIGYTKALLKHT
jgi:sugar phosphate isomerase/epimerase